MALRSYGGTATPCDVFDVLFLFFIFLFLFHGILSRPSDERLSSWKAALDPYT